MTLSSQGYSCSIEVWGPYACFTRPEFGAERETYDCITPSAAVGILKCIYWHPGMDYVIDKIYVLNPVQHLSVKRNEVKEKLNSRNAKIAMENGTEFFSDGKTNFTQRNTHLLTDVRYVIEAHPVITDSSIEDLTYEKISNIFNRRVSKGQSYRTPCFGSSEFEAFFKEVEKPFSCDPSLIGRFDLGQMLHSIDYAGTSIRPRFFRAKLVNGVLQIPDPESEEVYYVY